MTAHIIPFPRTRNRPFVMKHAARMAQLPEKTAAKHLAYQLQVQRETMERRGIAPELIDEELRALESAIRSELWYVVMSGGGVA